MFELLSGIDFAWSQAWLLLPWPLLRRYILPENKKPDELVRVPFLPYLIDEIRLDSHPARDGRIRSTIFWLVWGLLVCALAQPEYLTPPQHTRKSMRDIVLIIDVSGSMDKVDIPGGVTRLQAVQNAVHKFVGARTSDRIGMVIFASKAWPFAPVSEDQQALNIRINQLTPGMIGQQTAIGDALGVAIKLLDSSQNKDASKLAILLTDGNDTASQLSPLLAAKLAASHQVQIHTIAFGDPHGTGDNRVDLPLLQAIAGTTGGKFWAATNSGAVLDSVLKEIDAITPVLVKNIGWSWHMPLFSWPLGLAMVLLLSIALLRIILERRQ